METENDVKPQTWKVYLIPSGDFLGKVQCNLTQWPFAVAVRVVRQHSTGTHTLYMQGAKPWRNSQ